MFLVFTSSSFFSIPFQHDQLQQSRDEEDLIKARQKLLLRPVAKNASVSGGDDDDDADDADDVDKDVGDDYEEDVGSKKREMTELTVKSSPVQKSISHFKVVKSPNFSIFQARGAVCSG